MIDFTKKPILAMIHMAGHDQAVDRAIAEMKLLEAEGIEGVIIENYHGQTRDVIGVLKELKNHDFKLSIGINILPNEWHESLMYAGTYGADFIQLDFVAGLYKGVAKFDEINFINMRDKYPEVTILGGVHPKYYRPVEGSILSDDLRYAMDIADAIVVTGEGTGKETPLDKIKKFREIIGDFPLIIGAGMDATNVGEQMPFADGAIVGSCFKPHKRTQDPISRTLVREFVTTKKYFDGKL